MNLIYTDVIEKKLYWLRYRVENLWLRKWNEKRCGRMTAEVQLPRPLLKYVLLHCLYNLEGCGCMCSYLDRGLKNEDTQQTNKTRHTNYVIGQKDCLGY